MKKEPIKKYKKSAMKIAKELGYNEQIFNKIEKAETEIQVDIVMATARKNISDGWGWN